MTKLVGLSDQLNNGSESAQERGVTEQVDGWSPFTNKKQEKQVGIR